MRIIFIRHGMTCGNRQKRYIGSTDEELCRRGITEIKAKIKAKAYPPCERLVISPMKRCIQTANLIYPDMPYEVYENFRECDFGDFEGRNYDELKDNPYYKKWLDSPLDSEIPNGENTADFRKRCAEGFISLTENADNKTLSLVVHGGTVMSILEKYAGDNKSFYAWHIENACGYITEYSDGKIKILEKI